MIEHSFYPIGTGRRNNAENLLSGEMQLKELFCSVEILKKEHAFFCFVFENLSEKFLNRSTVMVCLYHEKLRVPYRNILMHFLERRTIRIDTVTNKRQRRVPMPRQPAYTYMPLARAFL